MDVSTSYSTSHQYTDDHMYAFYSFNQSYYDAFISTNTIGDNIDKTLIAKALALPPWNWNDKPTMDAYAHFFTVWGTHAITGTVYGWRCQIAVDCRKSNDIDESDFELSVKASYNGAANVSASGDIKTQNYYQTYQSSSNAESHVRGGNRSALASSLDSVNSSGDAGLGDAFKAWRDSNAKGTSEDICNVHLTALTDVLEESDDHTIVAKAADIANAFDYISVNGTTPGLFRVSCKFDFWSDWAEIDFTNSDTNIFIDVASVKSTEPDVTATPKSIHCNSGSLFTTVEFQLVTDAKTVDIMMKLGGQGDGHWSSLKFLDQTGNPVEGQTWNDNRQDGSDNAVPYVNVPVVDPAQFQARTFSPTLSRISATKHSSSPRNHIRALPSDRVAMKT